MSSFDFPKESLFDVQVSDGTFFTGCRFVDRDKHTVTFDYRGPLGTMLRAQMRTRDIFAVFSWPPLSKGFPLDRFDLAPAEDR